MTTLPRDDYFLWPADWLLKDCGSGHPDHLRAPINVGMKNPAGIRSLIVGLNPGATELVHRRFFVGNAGMDLRCLYDPLWEKITPDETLVTNIVKIGTPGQDDLLRLEERATCVRGCFLAEVRALPTLKEIFLLGRVAQALFRQLVEPELSGRVVVIYNIRHPSRSRSLGTGLRERLRAQLATPRHSG
jgi:uracil-DNA glycosylase